MFLMYWNHVKLLTRSAFISHKYKWNDSPHHSLRSHAQRCDTVTVCGETLSKQCVISFKRGCSREECVKWNLPLAFDFLYFVMFTFTPSRLASGPEPYTNQAINQDDTSPEVVGVVNNATIPISTPHTRHILLYLALISIHWARYLSLLSARWFWHFVRTDFVSLSIKMYITYNTVNLCLGAAAWGTLALPFLLVSSSLSGAGLRHVRVLSAGNVDVMSKECFKGSGGRSCLKVSIPLSLDISWQSQFVTNVSPNSTSDICTPPFLLFALSTVDL